MTTHPLIGWPDALDHEAFIGSCDWGGCDHPGWGLRWSADRGEYLTVCRGHANNLRHGRHDGGRAQCERAVIDDDKPNGRG